MPNPDTLNLFFGLVTVASLVLTVFLLWRATKTPSITFNAPFSDAADPLVWWHAPVVIDKKHWWQQSEIKSCEAELIQYGSNGKPNSKYVLLWRTSQGPKTTIDLKITQSPAVLALAACQTSGQNMNVNPDPINLPPIDLTSHSAIITDEIAICERRFSILSTGMHPLGV